MEETSKKILSNLQKLDNCQKELISRTDNLEKGQVELISRTDNLEKGQEQLISGQQEIKDLIDQSTTLMTENFTALRKDIKAFYTKKGQQYFRDYPYK